MVIASLTVDLGAGSKVKAKAGVHLSAAVDFSKQLEGVVGDDAGDQQRDGGSSQ